MPSLSKKKGRRRRANPEREVAKAQRILQKHKSENFLKNQTEQGQSWKYGHLTPKQVMTGSDKLFNKKVIKVSKSRNLADDTNDNNPYHKSQYNDDRNLEHFEDDQILRHQLRAMNDLSDIDPSDSELENDSDALKNIDDHDEIFSVRRNKSKDQEDEDELLESSGDDLDRDEDDLPFEQNEDNTVDIDEEIKDELDDIDSEETEEKKQSQNNKRGRRATTINMKEIQQHIMNDGDEDRKRLLNLSQSLQQKNTIRNDRLYDSDSSAYYKSSDDNIEDIQDMERNKYKQDGDDDVDIAEHGVGKVFWGNSRKDYYGADGVNRRFKSKSEKEQYQELRDEEAIGIQMQKDELMHQRGKDFVDLEMEDMMRQQMGNKYNKDIKPLPKLQKDTKEELSTNLCSWYNDDNDQVIASENEDADVEVEIEDADVEIEDAEIEDVSDDIESEGKTNIEKIRKENIGGMSKILRRDHPELPGMLKELKNIVSEMKGVYGVRQKAIQKRFDDAIDDSTLFIELLRTYSSTICFYLQLKSQKMDMDKMKKHGIYGVLLKLKQRVSKFRNIYSQSIGLMNNLEDDWDRSDYLKHKRELFEYQKQREQEVHQKRMMKENEKQKQKRIENKKLKKRQKRERGLKRKLFKKGFNRLNKEDVKLEGDDARRGITTKIFKSQGLKRYRKQGIPRVKARIKYEKKMKLWKKKGFKTFKGKLPNGRMEYNINTNLTHSKRLT